MGMPKPCRRSGGKRKFATHEQALIRAGEVAGRNGMPSVLGAYKCPHCGWYHITKQV